MASRSASVLARLEARRALKVPDTTGSFWVAKALSTALGESTSDYLVHTIGPVPAVLAGFVAFWMAMGVQVASDRYRAVTYWTAVVMVGVFGTMAADVLHVGMGVPYEASSALFALVLAGVFVAWAATEGTLSVHSIDTPRRELFYWAAVVATFALGTALGDLSAVTFHLGYFKALAVFAAAIAVPALGWRFGGWNPVASFWAAYVLTRPVGATVADGFGKPVAAGGLGVGQGPTSLVLAIAIVALVTWLAVTEAGVQTPIGAHAARSARPVDIQ